MLDTDEHWMHRALELAERGRGHVEPNPLVGAVVVRKGQVIGEGWHQRYRAAHAEVNALAAAGDAACSSTLYVTLEPCCHHGKTPPCTDAILAAGVTRVVAAMQDPFPQVAGRGADLLRSAGIPVDLGLCEPAARRLNAPYLKLLATGTPYLHAKWAMSLDGKIAAASKDSRWISNEASRRRGHQLRGRLDAIVVGIETVLADDPLLTARPPGPRTPTRIVLDSRLRIPLECRLVRTAHDAPLLVIARDNPDPAKLAALAAAGAEVLQLHDLPALLQELGRRRATNVLVEGGSRVLGSFLDARLIDEFHVFLAPKILGGSAAPSPVGGQGAASIAEALVLTEWSVEPIDGDVLIHGWTAAARSL